jgi:hypothetical protein
MCQPAPVVNRYGRDVASRFGIPAVFNQPGPGGVFLGSVGDQAHATRKSSHNCAPMQEDPVGGVDYHPNFAHAWDARPATKQIGEKLAAETLKDPRVRYVIYDNVGRKPNGERWSTDHPTFHVSFLPGTHNDTRPFFDQTGGLMPDDVKDLKELIEKRTDGKEQRQRDRAKLTAIGRVARETAVAVAEIAEAVNADKRIDKATLAAVRNNADALALILSEDDEGDGV